MLPSDEEVFCYPNPMPTVFERLTVFYERTPNFQFSATKKKRLCEIIKKKYDSYESNPPIAYRDVEENGERFQVRDYPELFTKYIDSLIAWWHHVHLKNTASIPVIETTKKERKRVPAKRPVYSVKPTAQNL